MLFRSGLGDHTISDATGYYQFTHDNTVNTTPRTRMRLGRQGLPNWFHTFQHWVPDRPAATRTTCPVCALPAMAMRAHIIGLNRAFGVALGGVKLKVAATDKEQALLILQETEHRPYLDEDDQPVCCPKCGSTDLQSGVSKPRTNSGKFHWLLGLLFGVYPIVMERGMNCNACGEQFVPEEVAAVTT